MGQNEVMTHHNAFRKVLEGHVAGTCCFYEVASFLAPYVKLFWIESGGLPFSQPFFAQHGRELLKRVHVEDELVILYPRGA